jgi:CheY-like chemotaxis protein/two-component sensor histidine kinase
LLILADQLAQNTEGNLSAKQIEFAKTIHASGNDLLSLINDILDLSKIESGTVSVDISALRFHDLHDYVERTFRHVAEAKGVEFKIEMDPDLPANMFTDSQRLEQVIRNLLSNAFKFTEQGQVVFNMATVTEGWNPDNEVLNHARSVIALSVSDTGIGIAPEKQHIIFEAFQQADGSTSRKYGGTGLGLAISREIARLLGGEIRLASAVGQGSTFTLFLPQTHVPMRTLRKDSGLPRSITPLGPQAGAEVIADNPNVPVEMVFEDDRGHLNAGDQFLLIIEDDPNYARILLEMAHEKGFKGVVAQRGAAALALARDLKPTAITLDLHLPDLDGWRVLDRLKVDLATRHIPVHIITVEGDPAPTLSQGALGFVTKSDTRESLQQVFDQLKEFIERPVKNLLVVEDDEIQTLAIREIIGNGDVKTTVVGTGKEALAAVQSDKYDCMVLDLGLPDMSGTELLEQIKQSAVSRSLPVIVYTARELLVEESAKLQQLAETILIKDVRSPERLLDETALLLHLNIARLPERQRKMLETLHHGVLENKVVLLVDDDIRNIFAMTSVLERFKMRVVSAENGKDAIDLLNEQHDIDIVLMDIMLPMMDGYTTIRAIREIPRFRQLPIIAVTAKAMKGDREKCIDAGASDYLCKPVEAEQLRSTLRLWLHR